MSTLAMRHFDLLNFVKKSKELGMPEPLAEYQGRQFEEVIEMAIESAQEVVNEKNLATQKDIKELDVKISELQKETQKIQKEIKEIQIELKKLEVKMERMRNHTIMWMISLFVASGFLTHFIK